MKIKWLEQEFSVGKWTKDMSMEIAKPFHFAAKTDKEFSLLCPTADMPKDVQKREDGWVGFRIEGELDFGLIGILAEISAVLADAKVGIFAVSTFDTDYIFFKKENRQVAEKALQEKGICE